MPQFYWIVLNPARQREGLLTLQLVGSSDLSPSVKKHATRADFTLIDRSYVAAHEPLLRPLQMRK